MTRERDDGTELKLWWYRRRQTSSGDREGDVEGVIRNWNEVMSDQSVPVK
jgi:hypothetical protein